MNIFKKYISTPYRFTQYSKFNIKDPQSYTYFYITFNSNNLIFARVRVFSKFFKIRNSEKNFMKIIPMAEKW